jgi:para-nitrobenzyl esterase
MSEDCLTLNVTAPEAPADEGLPVMVFIHGGAYILGSSATPIYDGATLARGGCVYVSVNYRLGALGCLDLSSLSTPDDVIESNLFLRDLVMALEWVRDNIAVFGGDPDNVTIFGESAGAQAVVALLAVPSAKGLFHRAISESPAAGVTRSQDLAARFAQRFATLIGARRSDAAHALKVARPHDLVNAVDKLIVNPSTALFGAFPLGPSYGDDVLPVEPLEAMRTGVAHRVPVIVGTNADEGRLFTRFLRILPTTEHAVEAMLGGAGSAIRDRIIDAYPGYPAPAACARIGGDFAFTSAVWQVAEARAAASPTYVYRYDYAPRPLHWSGLGATHATELFAVFDVYRSRLGAALTLVGDRKAARRVSNDVQRCWREFARTGKPGGGWPPYNLHDRAVMVFDRNPGIEFDPHPERRGAWDGFTLTN